MTNLRLLLRGLCDVDGVIGIFVLSDGGGLLDRDLPATFDAGTFAEAGPRIIRLAELGSSYGDGFRFFVIRFAEHKLYVRTMAGAFLGVLVAPSTSLPALKAAANLIARRVEALLVAGSRPDGSLGWAPTSRAPPTQRGRSSVVPPPLSAASVTLPSAAPADPASSRSSAPPGEGAPSRRAMRFRGREI